MLAKGEWRLEESAATLESPDEAIGSWGKLNISYNYLYVFIQFQNLNEAPA